MLQKMPKHFHVQLSISAKCTPPLRLLIRSWEFPQYQRVLYIFFIAFSVMTDSHRAHKLSDDARPECSPVYTPKRAPLCLPGLVPQSLREPACVVLRGALCLYPAWTREATVSAAPRVSRVHTPAFFSTRLLDCMCLASFPRSFRYDTSIPLLHRQVFIKLTDSAGP